MYGAALNFICSILGLATVQNSYGVLGTNLEGTLFNLYCVVLIVSPHKYSGSSAWLIIYLTMSRVFNFDVQPRHFVVGCKGLYTHV